MPTPNIFQFATTELSQDAVTCWLVACAREADGGLRECGRDFVRALVQHGQDGLRGPCEVTDVDHPKRQHEGIDVYFQARVDGQQVTFVVEDKTDTEMHGGQLERYRDLVGRDDDKEDDFCLVYYKTGYVYDDERCKAKAAGYRVFDAEDMRRFLAAQGERDEHEILRQYREHIDGILAQRDEQLAQWQWSHPFVQYEFMRGLRGALLDRCEEWAPALGEKVTDYFPRGANVGGGPWTQYWVCDALGCLDDAPQLRLRVWTDDSKKLFPGWTEETWHKWMAAFRRLLVTCGLPEAYCQPRMRYRGALVNEGTVGAIDLSNGPADRWISQIVDLHVAFLAEISATDRSPVSSESRSS